MSKSYDVLSHYCKMKSKLWDKVMLTSVTKMCNYEIKRQNYDTKPQVWYKCGNWQKVKIILNP